MRRLSLGLGLNRGFSGGGLIKNLSFANNANGVTVVGSSLASGYGSDGLIAWPAHNLISPSTTLTGSGWSGSNGATTPTVSGSLPATNSSWSKSCDTGLISTLVGEKFIARCAVRAVDAGNVGKKIRLALRENPASAYLADTNETSLLDSFISIQFIKTIANASQTSMTMYLAPPTILANCPTAYQAKQPQMARYPMSPDRYVETTDVTAAPYSPAYAEMIDHFVTTGVNRGLRVRSGVDTATYNIGTTGLYDLTYYWVDTDQTTILSQTVTQYASGGVLTLSPPVGEHILQLKISAPIIFSLTEFSVNGLVFGVSGGGVNGAGATAPIRLSGQAPIGKTIEARIRQGGSTIVNWHTIGTTSSASFAFKTSAVPRGEGYTAEIRLQDVPSIVVTMTNTFHCRDLIFGTGSSNMQNGFIQDGGAAITAFETQFKLYNNNKPVTIGGIASGGSVIIGSSAGESNRWYYMPTGVSTDIVTWESFGDCVLGAQLKVMLDEIGGEVTAFMDGSGANDLGWFQDAEEQRVYKLAQSRKFQYACQLSGRNIPFIQQEIGILRGGTSVGNDIAQNEARKTQFAMRAEYPGIIYPGGVMWDQDTADGSHLLHYSTLWERHCRCIIDALGYASGIQVRGPYLSSAVKTSSTIITAQITLRGGTGITPTSAMSGWGVLDNGVQVSISSVSVGVAVSGVVPVVITLSSPLVGTASIDYRFGNGLRMTPSTDPAVINPLLANTGRDNGTYALPIEWVDTMVVT